MIRKGFLLPVVLAILENESLAYIISLEKQIHIHTYVKTQSLYKLFQRNFRLSAKQMFPKVKCLNCWESL